MAPDPQQANARDTQVFFAQDLAILGRTTLRTGERREMVIARVDPRMPDGDQVARDIAAALNLKFL